MSAPTPLPALPEATSNGRRPWWARLLPVLFVCGGLALLLRREWLTGLGALLVVPSAIEGARPPPTENAPSRARDAVAALALLGLALFLAGWLLD